MASKYSKQVVNTADPVRKPTELEIAWVAGFYEGEGHVSGIKGRTMAHLSQKDPEILFRVRELFGGSIIQVRIDTPKYCHAWKLCGDRGRMFLQTIYPYLSIRRKMQIEKAGAFRLTGKGQRDHTPMAEDRKSMRASMSTHEKAKESYRAHREKNYEKVTEYQREYSRRKRLGLSTRGFLQNSPVSQVVH